MSWPVALEDVRNELKQTPSATLFSVEDLEGYAVSAMSKAETIVGPRRGQRLRHSERLRGRNGSVGLRHRAASVQSVTLDGAAVAGWEHEPDGDEGSCLLEFPDGIGHGRLVVQYTAPATVWPDVEQATIVLAAHEALQRKPGMGAAGDVGSPMGFAFPNRVTDVFERHAEPRFG